MRPPECELCSVPCEPVDDARVRFGAGSEVAGRGAPLGTAPDADLGWFCPEHVDGARRLAASHTLAGALAAMRAEAVRRPHSARSVLGVTRDGSAGVCEVMDCAAPGIAEASSGSRAGPMDETTSRERFPSPEPRESATSVEWTRRRTWRAGGWEVSVTRSELRWDGGERIRASVILAIDPDGANLDDRFLLVASFQGEDAAGELSTRGIKPQAARAPIEELLERLKSAAAPRR